MFKPVFLSVQDGYIIDINLISTRKYVLEGNDSAVIKYIISSGCQIDVNDVTIFDRDVTIFEDWLECGVTEAAWVKTNQTFLKLQR